jgi:hypothetical protein
MIKESRRILASVRGKLEADRRAKEREKRVGDSKDA